MIKKSYFLIRIFFYSRYEQKQAFNISFRKYFCCFFWIFRFMRNSDAFFNKTWYFIIYSNLFTLTANLFWNERAIEIITYIEYHGTNLTHIFVRIPNSHMNFHPNERNKEIQHSFQFDAKNGKLFEIFLIAHVRSKLFNRYWVWNLLFSENAFLLDFCENHISCDYWVLWFVFGKRKCKDI